MCECINKSRLSVQYKNNKSISILLYLYTKPKLKKKNIKKKNKMLCTYMYNEYNKKKADIVREKPSATYFLSIRASKCK